MKESAIKHENGSFWVGKVKNTFTVYHSGSMVSTPDSSYPATADGLSIAVARCNYLAKRTP